LKRLRAERLRVGPRQSLEVRVRVAPQLVGRAEQQHPHLATQLAQQPRAHQSVAAVVALAADDGDRARWRQLLYMRREARPRALHQLDPRDPALADRPLVEGPLLSGVGQWLEPVRKRHAATATAAA